MKIFGSRTFPTILTAAPEELRGFSHVGQAACAWKPYRIKVFAIPRCRCHTRAGLASSVLRADGPAAVSGPLHASLRLNFLSSCSQLTPQKRTGNTQLNPGFPAALLSPSFFLF